MGGESYVRNESDCWDILHWARGQASDIRIQANEILYLKDRLNTELSDRTGQPLDRIQQDTDRDFFMSPSEAVDYGLIDSVIDKRPVKPVA
jgi:ATP-dependent Clp protease protease subunit